MRCLILGGDGMLGHQLLLSWQDKHDVRVTLRQPLSTYRSYGIFHEKNSFDNLDVRRSERLLEIMGEFQPDTVINAVGIIKQRDAAQDRLASLEMNSVLPHQLNLLCKAVGARLVHISTDCVFNGQKGNYTENSPSDAKDVYGKSKFLGEVSHAPGITLRSSIIGLELKNKRSLIEWYLAQTGTIKGFTKAIYTGLTTLEMSRVIEFVSTEHRELNGVWQVASTPICKFDLLTRLTEKLDRDDLTIEPDEDFFCDRSLSGKAFREKTGCMAPSWDAMLSELAGQIRERNRMKIAA